jgi:hypothetical protein
VWRPGGVALQRERNVDRVVNLSVGQHQIRGSGAVIISDEGTVQVLREEPNHLSFVLHGQKLTGRFGLTQTGERRWILVKAKR